MKKDEFKELLKKCFGKHKDDRYHAIAMLIVYFIFISIVVLVIRMGDTTLDYGNSNDDNQAPIVDFDSMEEDENNIESNVNYSYSYNVSYNGISEIYLGKKVNEKEKFTLLKDGINTNYAILSDNFLIMEDETYRITENPSRFFKYCNLEKIMKVIENEISIESNNTVKYNISNETLSKFYKDNILKNNNLENTIQLIKENDVVKSADIDLSNYISSVDNSNSSLIIHMEFVDIGTIEDFEINIY